MVSTISVAVSLKVSAVARTLVRTLSRYGDIDAMIAEDATKQIDVGQTRHVVRVATISRVRRLAIIKGSAAFLAPLIGMVPVRRVPPTIRMRSMTVASLTPLPRLILTKTPVGRAPLHASVNTPSSTFLPLTLSPLITIPRLLSGFGLFLAFQQICPEFGGKPGLAGFTFGLICGAVFVRSARRSRILLQEH